MKRPKDMTPEELAALPEVGLFAYDEYTVPASGILALPDGRVMVGLRGDTVRVPKAQPARVTSMTADDLACWSDADGSWTPVMTEDGWAKRRVSL